MIGYLLVAAGAAVGAPLRYLVDRVVQGRHRSVFPWGTFTVNVAGSVILGAVTAAALTGGAPNEWELLLGIGVCGAFTTYSTFAYETIRLLQQRAHRVALVNAIASVLVGVLGATIGFAVTRAAL